MNAEANAKVELGIVPMANDVFRGSDLRSFSMNIQKRIMLKDTIKAAELQIKDIDEVLTGAMSNKDTEALMWGNHKVEIITKTNNRLVKEKLIENGVSAQVIADSMVTSYSSYLQVREIKAKESEE